MLLLARPVTKDVSSSFAIPRTNGPLLPLQIITAVPNAFRRRCSILNSRAITRHLSNIAPLTQPVSQFNDGYTLHAKASHRSSTRHTLAELQCTHEHTGCSRLPCHRTEHLLVLIIETRYTYDERAQKSQGLLHTRVCVT